MLCMALLGEELPKYDNVLGHLEVLEPAGVVEDGLETPVVKLQRMRAKVCVQQVRVNLPGFASPRPVGASRITEYNITLER